MWGFLQYFGGAFMGWSLGANDTANVFGTAVSSRMVSYKTAVILSAVFVVLGAVLQGEAGIRTLSEDLRRQENPAALESPEKHEAAKRHAVRTALIVTLSAALTVTVMTVAKIPVSCSQAVVGAIIGLGLIEGGVNFSGLVKVVICWVGTPIGAALVTVALYYPLKKILDWWRPSVFVYDPVMSLLLIVCGCYGAYALGANNVANVSAMYVGEGMMTPSGAALFGGIAIAFGVVTYSKPVMMTVGSGIVPLNAFTAFICVLSNALTVHFYALAGVPVSSSQAVVGAVLGVGFIRGAHTVNVRTLAEISVGWVSTPVVAALAAAAGWALAALRWLPD